MSSSQEATVISVHDVLKRGLLNVHMKGGECLL